ncbi:MAG TPA: hypothetical protein VGM91_12200 [Conexibacter sp.]|jgi:hypothetical protein
MLISGELAPPQAFHAVTKQAYAESIGVWPPRPNEEGRNRSLIENIRAVLDAACEMEAGLQPDEVTLIDAAIFPAIEAQGTRSGGRKIPALRVPTATITSWWIVEGETVRGRGGISFGAGVLFPLDA